MQRIDASKARGQEFANDAAVDQQPIGVDVAQDEAAQHKEGVNAIAAEIREWLGDPEMKGDA
jgi:hypothetical protein